MRSPNLRSVYSFPPAESADENGLLAYGGDLTPERLICAYESGIFPWYEEGQPILWWSPPERMVLKPDEFKASKSLKREIKREVFEIRIDTAFEEVIENCAKLPRRNQDGTWITPAMNRAYTALHHLGFAHSFETWQDGKLVGGLYGVSLGKVFFGESMFSKKSNASKVAFHALSEFALTYGLEMIDCQLHTDHLESLGARLIPRKQYLKQLRKALDHPDMATNWMEL